MSIFSWDPAGPSIETHGSARGCCRGIQSFGLLRVGPGERGAG